MEFILYLCNRNNEFPTPLYRDSERKLKKLIKRKKQKPNAREMAIVQTPRLLNSQTPLNKTAANVLLTNERRKPWQFCIVSTRTIVRTL